MKREDIAKLETYSDALKMFHDFLKKAKTGPVGDSTERAFLEIKTLLAQGAEINAPLFRNGQPKKEEIFQMLNSIPTLSFANEVPEQTRTTENLWNKLLMQVQMLIGQMKNDPLYEVMNKQEKKGGGWWK